MEHVEVDWLNVVEMKDRVGEVVELVMRGGEGIERGW